MDLKRVEMTVTLPNYVILGINNITDINKEYIKTRLGTVTYDDILTLLFAYYINKFSDIPIVTPVYLEVAALYKPIIDTDAFDYNLLSWLYNMALKIEDQIVLTVTCHINTVKIELKGTTWKQ